MAKVVNSPKKSSVKNGTEERDDSQKICKRNLLNYVTGYQMKQSDPENSQYFLSVCGTQCDQNFKIAVTSSNYNCRIYSVDEGLTIQERKVFDHKAPIVGIKFSSTSSNILYTANNKGEIKMFDVRMDNVFLLSEGNVSENTENEKINLLTSFDVSCDDRLIAAGTEHAGGDAFILFWDIRYTKTKSKVTNNLLGGYWQSHTDDVTCLSFDPARHNVLASGSTDGLINIFDLVQSSEDDALTCSLNTESSVDKLGWSSNNSLWCTTHTYALQLWNCEDVSPYAKFERSRLAVLPDDDPDDCYVVRYHPTNALGQPFLLAGSSTDKGENLSCLSVANENRLEPCAEIVGNNQAVRDSWVHEKSNILVTVGEGCAVSLWRDPERISKATARLAKMTLKEARQQRVKPY